MRFYITYLCICCPLVWVHHYIDMYTSPQYSRIHRCRKHSQISDIHWHLTPQNRETNKILYKLKVWWWIVDALETPIPDQLINIDWFWVFSTSIWIVFLQQFYLVLEFQMHWVSMQVNVAAVWDTFTQWDVHKYSSFGYILSVLGSCAFFIWSVWVVVLWPIYCWFTLWSCLRVICIRV